ncbi:hypothetical protein TheetDRAFT_2090 [Thermoanaerobacter ethanolicus JW 200]|uniref:Uncharacterized protein n=2 Tax=Thermoanaerobacter TaxID=1754 RepID=I8QWA1_9THEO|nr:hypothetical protein TheetDRAFT_2090 [Thermoanaerobacter ethanolicus JW 200]EIV99197.1 hypothetical protein ThesiDRAFT1_0160 [Thermoanaerobacter siderophilus SR4]EMT39551.1 hypothetical protein TthWC1_0988 [Thermoanaerobacter thermohydrosulfuricus WC1]
MQEMTGGKLEITDKSPIFTQHANKFILRGEET